MKIVVLDGFTLNPGDFSWESLNELGELTIHDRTAPSDVLRRAEGAEALLRRYFLQKQSIRFLT